MYRRVVVPVLLAFAVLAAGLLLNSAVSLHDKNVIQALTGNQAAYRIWPPYVGTSWLLFPTIFLAVRMCALREGSRRECFVVALAPALTSGIVGAVFVMMYSGASAPLLVLGSTRPVVQGYVTVGSGVAVHQYVSNWLSALATSLAVYWLYLFMARHPVRLPAAAAAATSPDATASAQTPA